MKDDIFRSVQESHPNMYKSNFLHHPVYLNDYTIVTEAIDSIHKRIEKLLRSPQTSLVIYAPSGTGKTVGLEKVKNLLLKDDPSLPIYLVTFRASPNNQKELYIRILNAICPETEFVSISHKTDYNLCQQTIAALIAKAVGSIRKRIILFLDEADNLSWKDYQNLKDISNILSGHKISLISVLVGSDELKTKKNAFQASGDTQIVRRFMTQEMQMQGIIGLKQLSHCLIYYDSLLKFDNLPATIYFFPDNESYQLAYDTQLFDDLIKDMLGTDLLSGSGMRMYFFRSIIDYLFTEYGIFSDNPHLQPDEKCWINAIDSNKNLLLDD